MTKATSRIGDVVEEATAQEMIRKANELADVEMADEDEGKLFLSILIEPQKRAHSAQQAAGSFNDYFSLQ